MNGSIGSENLTRSYFRTRRTPSPTDAIIIIHHPNAFRDSLRSLQYFEIVDEFMQAVKHRWPKCLVQFEDFRSDVAQPLLNNYRDSHLCFNDDIQVRQSEERSDEL